jgi:hypothetical protein
MIAIDSSNNVYGVSQDENYVVKYNSSGTLQWQRSFTGTTIGFTGIYWSNNNLYITGLFDTNGGLFIIKDDGSGTGTYVLGLYTITYGASSLTDSAGSATDASVTVTDSTASGTGSSASLTDTAASNTITKVNL